MKRFTPLQIQLIEILSDGNCHSGNKLGQQLGISRTAVWKHISQLADLGFPIKRHPHKGYQSTVTLKILDESIIRQRLNDLGFNQLINLHLFAEIDSTNRFLQELPQDSWLTLCCAEKQTEGRGRFGRHWNSPFGENIYCSIRWLLDCCLSQLSGLSLVVSLAILAALKACGIHDEAIKVKWPNDLLWGIKKLCGILIEIIAETNGRAQVIIGIGLNVNTHTNEQALSDKPACSLYEITGRFFDRNHLIAAIIYHLDQYLHDFLKQGFSFFMPHWQPVDYLKGQTVSVSQPSGFIHGQVLGVNEWGQLCLEDEEGKIRYLSSGDTSLKRIT